MTRRLAALPALLLLISACVELSPPATGLPQPQAGWPIIQTRIDDRLVRLVVAIDHDLGMRGVTGLPETVHGMLFEYRSAADPGLVTFTMRGVPIDLDAFFFDADGVLIDGVRMAACPADPCPSYGTDRPFRWVVESPAGRLAVADGARLELAR